MNEVSIYVMKRCEHGGTASGPCLQQRSGKSESHLRVYISNDAGILMRYMFELMVKLTNSGVPLTTKVKF